MDDLSKFFADDNLDGARAYVDGLPQNVAHTWFLRGRLLSRLGDMSGALSCYHKAVDLDPNCQEALSMIEFSNGIYEFRDPNLLNP